MDDFLRNRLFRKPTIELERVFSVTVIFTNGRSLTHQHMTGIDSNDIEYHIWNSHETYVYPRQYIFAIHCVDE